MSPYMLELAKKYLDTPEYRERLKVIKFVENDIAKYLTGERENSIDLAIMKYAIDHIQNIDQLFNLLQKKLKK
ncbi:MAG: methyltransferase domain-containing protein [bacterium]|nr:methyltransferase domain-containing protein [bacterium]